MTAADPLTTPIGPSDAGRHWALDPDVDFLNHGSFGACPTPVLAAARQWQDRMERRPVAFFELELEPEMDHARQTLARFLRAAPEDLAWVENATTGVNTVLRSLPWQPGDELLTTDHAYNACRNALDFVAGRTGARVVSVPIRFPGTDPAEVVAELVAAATDRTRLLLLDHITSPSGLVLPACEIVAAMHERGIDTLVDGAHAPGMVALDLERLGAAYYTGNCHKWLCTAKGSAFLHVRRNRQENIRPLVISHGANDPRTDRSRFQLEMGWTGTRDPSAWLSTPAAMDFLAGLRDGGDPIGSGLRALQEHNRELVIQGRRLLCDALGIAAPCPEEMLGSLAAVPLPDLKAADPGPDPLHGLLRDHYQIEVPVMPNPAVRSDPALPPRLLRISAQIHNHLAQYERLARVLPDALAAVR